ncbi:hypothetical protein AAG906_001707 [Vitis piasezkii]
MKSQLSTFNAKAGMYTLKEDDDMKAKLAAMTRKLEELELKRIHEVQVVLKHRQARATQYQQPDPPSQQSSSLEQAMANLSKVVGDFVGNQEATNAQINQRIDRGRFPSQPHQNPKGVHEVESQEGESSQMKDVKALITLRSGKKIEKPTPKPHVEKEEEIKKGKEMEDKESEISEEKKDSDSTMNAIPEKELLKEEMLKKSTSPPFPQALHGKKGIRNVAEILEVLRQVKVNIPCWI